MLIERDRAFQPPWLVSSQKHHDERSLMAILDRKVETDQVANQPEPDQSFAEIDAKQFDRARKDPKTQHLHAAADRHLETLRAEGRID